MSYQGYSIRLGQISLTASDSKGWYGVHFFGPSKASSLKHVELQANFGFAARPVDAKDGYGCNGFYSLDGEFAWLGHDARFTDKCPALTQGSSAQWNSEGAYALLDTETKTWKLHVPRASGEHEITVGEINGEEVIVVRHSGGAVAKITAQKVLVTGAELHVGENAKLLAIAEKVDKAIANIQRHVDTHVHYYCLGPTGTPMVPCTPETSVACSKSLSE